MPKFHGISPQPATQKAAERFENEVMIRKNNRFLVSTVYLDMEVTRWAVAIAYNPSRNPGLHGHEHLLEVRYSYEPDSGHQIIMFRSDPYENTPLPCKRLFVPDSFAQYVLEYERKLLDHPV
ncbi:MAG: hypothetical protein Q7V05_04840 [Methanoregula sp.]|uniref:hypothetical protein n=1 Tax=Methanocalculus sp. TaxID=2004547 RepID=UPI002716F5A0|nr:hypothetical protein [Methanocalculus sp.]MDO8872045.1 hypothetical protein [Methanoregula sp.]MDO9539817.1 hypothetical protein [Methanocalculus sp.]